MKVLPMANTSGAGFVPEVMNDPGYRGSKVILATGEALHCA